jgi:hypothetical protein
MAASGGPPLDITPILRRAPPPREPPKSHGTVGAPPFAEEEHELVKLFADRLSLMVATELKITVDPRCDRRVHGGATARLVLPTESMEQDKTERWRHRAWAARDQSSIW